MNAANIYKFLSLIFVERVRGFFLPGINGTDYWIENLQMLTALGNKQY
jgi:hypothetical protein